MSFPSLADASLSNVFSNTISVLTTTGTTILIYPNEDGSYTGTLPNDSKIEGSWAQNGDETCFTRTQSTTSSTVCHLQLENKMLGDTWESTDPEGNPTTVTLVEGR
jgi:hypothetical protein